MSARPLFTRNSGFGPLARIVTTREGARPLRTLYNRIGYSFEDAQPHGLISLGTMTDAFETAAHVTGDPLLGFNLGMAMDITSYGPVGQYASAAPTPLDTLRRLARAVPFHTNGVFFQVVRRGADADLIIDYPMRPSEGLVHHALHVAIPFYQHLGAYLGPRPVVDEIGIGHASPKVRQLLEDALGVRVVPDVVAFRTQISAALLTATRIDGSRAWRDFTYQDVYRQLQPALPSSTFDAVKQVVRSRLDSQTVGLDDIARDLGYSRRTLQSRLTDEGISFRELLLKLRMTRARELLAQTELSIAEIAQEVGYSEQASFHRAFASHAGVTPGSWRSVSADQRNAVNAG